MFPQETIRNVGEKRHREETEDLPSRSWRALKWRRWRRCHTRIWFWMNEREPLCSSEQTKTRAEKNCTRGERQRQRRVRRGGIWPMRMSDNIMRWGGKKQIFGDGASKIQVWLSRKEKRSFYITYINSVISVPWSSANIVSCEGLICAPGMPWLWLTFTCMWLTGATVNSGNLS